ncbi:MAG: hypothetical protein A2X86_17030 [Bdellovibrionales bacterium GWA2_49_15]|nr:MAG: hypothetical protein A2X86_17030 [Bdellovibrionales bacterium GWA2_49_15]HAZ14057.1 hypothetical protein [Bdellovibrionales bacterium]
MFVRKFEAETLEEALKEIKKELGPDAVILKTVTNKGLRGAFKKKKIEITAAISERNYSRKANVDQAITPAAKDKFYQADSEHIGKMIGQYSANQSQPKKSGSEYGNMALNRQVQIVQTSETNSATSRGLDDFLSATSEQELSTPSRSPAPQRSVAAPSKPPVAQKAPPQSAENTNQSRELYLSALDKIADLERKIFDLSKNLETKEKSQARGLYQLRNTLRSLDIDSSYIQKLLIKLQYELPENSLDNTELIFETALKEMMTMIKTDSAHFAKENVSGPHLTIFVSETSCGQTTLIRKLASISQNSVVVSYCPVRKTDTGETIEGGAVQENQNLACKIFGIETVVAKSISEILALCRKNSELGRDIFIDFKVVGGQSFEVKQLVDGVKRSFKDVETFVSLSAIHSEVYNRKILNCYQKLIDGIVIGHLDLCLNYGAIFNLLYAFNKIPLKFFSTGDVIPDDLEAATPERILAGLFHL